jgi:hypothetical protein
MRDDLDSLNSTPSLFRVFVFQFAIQFAITTSSDEELATEEEKQSEKNDEIRLKESERLYLSKKKREGGKRIFIFTGFPLRGLPEVDENDGKPPPQFIYTRL